MWPRPAGLPPCSHSSRLWGAEDGLFLSIPNVLGPQPRKGQCQVRGPTAICSPSLGPSLGSTEVRHRHSSEGRG